MQKLNYSSLNGQHIIDTRSQHSFQAGHIVGALNLNLANFKKYAINYFPTNEPMVFVTDDNSSPHLDDLQLSAKELGFTELSGYILFEEIPNSELRQSDTISAKDFLDLEGDYTLLDVRHPSEITRIAPKKNLNSIPFEDLPTSHQSLNDNKKIYTLCGSGNRGTAAASYLETLGFQPIIIEGGMKAIQNEDKYKATGK